MTTLAAAIAGLVMALGTILIVLGLVGMQPKPKSNRPKNTTPFASQPVAPWLVAGMLGFAIGWALTGWWSMGVTFAGGVSVIYYALHLRAIRRRADSMAEGLSGWAEMLSDVMKSHSAIGQAIQETAGSTAGPLRPHVMDLAARAQSRSLAEALEVFGKEVNHGTADIIVTALKIADQGQGRNIPAVLEKIAEQTRNRTEMVLSVEASRSNVYSEARAIVGITLFLVAASIAFGRAYLEPYSELQGEVVLLVVGALFVSGCFALLHMGRPIELPRLLQAKPTGADASQPSSIEWKGSGT